MQKSIRIIILILLGVMLFTVTSCDFITEFLATFTGSDEEGEEVEGDEIEAEPVHPDGIEDEASIFYWSMWNADDPQGIVILDAATAFREETGVQVYVRFNGRQTQEETLPAALAEQTRIDIFDGDIDFMTGQMSQHLLNLDELVETSFSDTGRRNYDYRVNRTLMDIARDKGGGRLNVIPYQPYVVTGMYNRDLFRQAGIVGVPRTWDELLEACASLVTFNIMPITVDDAFIPTLFGYTLTRVAGVDKTIRIFAAKEFDDPDVLTTAELLAELISKGYISPFAETNTYPEGQDDEFALGAAAIYLNGSWLPAEFEARGLRANWGFFAWPPLEMGDASAGAQYISSQAIGININTAFPNAAFSFIRYLTLGHYDQALALESTGIPMANSARLPSNLDGALTVINNTTDLLPWAAGAENDQRVANAIIKGFQQMVAGNINAEQFTDSLIALG